MSEVNKERVALLVEALESGKYTQGRNRLVRDQSFYCCLGVACEVAVEQGAAAVRAVSDDGVVSYDKETHVLPPAVADWYGFDTSSPMLNWRDGQGQADVLNDIDKLSFSDIASAFRSTYLEA